MSCDVQAAGPAVGFVDKKLHPHGVAELVFGKGVLEGFLVGDALLVAGNSELGSGLLVALVGGGDAFLGLPERVD